MSDQSSLISVSFDVSESDLSQLSHDTISTRIPGWNPTASDFAVPIIESNARIALVLLNLLADVPDDIAVGLGEKLFNVLRNQSARATSTARFTLGISGGVPGVTIPAGTQLGMTAPDTTTIGFQTTQDLTIAGVSTTGDVAVEATEAGAASNGLIGTGFMLQGVDAAITSVSLLTASSGGEDEEEIADYLPRLYDTTRLLTPTPILPPDFARMAMTVPGVGRALAIDLYQPSDNTYGHQRTVTIAVQDSAGQAVPSGVKDAVTAKIAASREQGWTFYVIDPLYTAITVAATVVKSPGADATQVQLDVKAAIASLLNPATWGGPTYPGQDKWSPSPLLKLNRVITAIGAVRGVQDVTSVTLNGSAADVTMGSGKPHALPQLSATATVTVT